MSGVPQTYCVLSQFMRNWCLEFLRLIMSGLCSCVAVVWSCLDLLSPLCVHVYLMSGVAQNYCVLSVFMCNWCLELFRLIVSSLVMCNWCLQLFRLIVSSLSSCVTDVWSCSDLLCLVCVHVYLMSGVVQTIVASLCPCVTDVWCCSDLL